jgi:Leucine-rich repeat (LRR) protein
MNPDNPGMHGKTKKTIITTSVLILLAGLVGWFIGRPDNITPADNSQSAISSTPTNNDTSLDLSGQQLTTVPAAVLNRSDVTTLNLSNNQLTTLPGNINNLKNLEVLIVENNRLESLPAEISQLKNLHEIRVNNNRMKNLPDSIDSMTQLKMLDISGNSIPASRVEQLKAKLMDADIKS